MQLTIHFCADKNEKEEATTKKESGKYNDTGYISDSEQISGSIFETSQPTAKPVAHYTTAQENTTVAISEAEEATVDVQTLPETVGLLNETQDITLAENEKGATGSPDTFLRGPEALVYDNEEEVAPARLVSTSTPEMVFEVQEINEEEITVVPSDPHDGRDREEHVSEAGPSEEMDASDRSDETQSLVGGLVTWPEIPQIKTLKDYIEQVNEEENPTMERFGLPENVPPLPVIRPPVLTRVLGGTSTEVDRIEEKTTIPDPISPLKTIPNHLRDLVGYVAGPHFVPQKINEEEKNKSITLETDDGKSPDESQPSIQRSAEEIESEEIYQGPPSEIGEENKSEDDFAKNGTGWVSEEQNKNTNSPKTLSWLNEFKRS